MSRCIILISCFFFFYVSTLLGSPNYNFKQITIKQGLTQSSVNSILFDSKGALWIGTKSGLNRFVRHELNNYIYDEDKKYSLPDNFIQFIAEDSHQKIWVSTGKGLVVYDPLKKEFNPVVQEKVFSFLLLEDGILFGGKKIIYKYNYQQQKIEQIPFGANKDGVSVNYNIIRLITLDERRILVGTRNMGIYIFDKETKQCHHLVSTNDGILLDLYLASDGRIYLSVFGQGIFCYNSEGQLIAEYSTLNSDLTNNIVLDIVEKDNKLWMGTDGNGISIFDLTTKQFTELHHIPGNKNSLPVNSISVLYKDINENLWAGSVRGGAFSIKEAYINTYTDAPLNNISGLSEKAVISLYEDDMGLLWIGTDGGGINSFDPRTGKFTHESTTYGDKVVSIAGLSDTELLVSLYSKGMFVFNTRTKQYQPFTIVDSSINQNEISSGYMTMGHKVGNNKVYILSLDSWVYHIREKAFTKIQAKENNYPLDGLKLAYSNDSVSYLMRDNQVFEVCQKDDRLRFLFSVAPEETINSLCYDGENCIWVASSRNGLGCYDLSTKKFEQKQTRLFYNISYLFLDKKNRLWISARNMLFSYIIDEDKFVVWSETDGFSENEILFMYQKQSKNNYIYLGGTEGLVQIDENVVYDEVADPEIELADVTFNGSPYVGLIQNQTIKIPWNYSSLSVSVGLIERDIFRQTMYKFTIIGTSEQTVETYSPIIKLPSLSPGKYSILVSYNTRDGSYTKASRIIDIIIVPPWYKSGWFIIIVLLSLIILIVLIAYFIIYENRIKLKLEMKEYEQQMNEEKINFLINISHELRTPLTLMYSLLRRLIDKSKDNSTINVLTKQLQVIYKQARQMKEIINMVLDINRLNATEDHINRQRCELILWIKNIVEEFSNELNAKNISIQFQLDKQIDFVFFDAWKCQIVLSNFLMNALKFSDPDTQIVISTEQKEKMVRIAVSDQGMGLHEEDIGKLFNRFYQGKHNKQGTGIGLSYSKTLIEKHGGNIGAYNNESKGATFYFEISSTLENDGLIFSKDNIILQHNDIKSVFSEFTNSEYSILIVEDEKNLREFLQELFIDKFKNVYAVDDGLKALKACKIRQPDIVISDVMMPEKDGYEFCKELKLDVEISHIPVILLTARSDQDSIICGYKLGADSYITKPFEADYLFTIIHNLLRARASIHERYRKGPVLILPQESTISKGDEDFMTKLNDVINRNISEPEFTINLLVDEIGMSRASLYNKVKAITNLGVNDYMNRIRIEKAVRLLTNSDLSVKEIAFEVGFTYSRYFSTVFKEIKGMTPTEFKNKKVSEKK